MRAAQLMAMPAVLLIGALATAQEETQRAQSRAYDVTPDRQVIAYLSLLVNDKVATELKLTDDQRETVREASRSIWSAAARGTGGDAEERAKQRAENFANIRTTLIELLDDPQEARLRQLWIQRDGVLMAVSDPEVAKDLGLSEEQVEQIGHIRAGIAERTQSMRQQGVGRGEAFRRSNDAQKEGDAELVALLTDDQKSKLETLKGEPFEFPATRSWSGRTAPSFQVEAPSGRQWSTRGLLQFLPVGTHVRLQFHERQYLVTTISDKAVEDFRARLQQIDDDRTAAKDGPGAETEEVQQKISRLDLAYSQLESPWTVVETGTDFVRLEPAMNIPGHESVEWLVVPVLTIASIKATK